MTRDPEIDNPPEGAGRHVPRMVGDSDVALIKSVASRLPTDARILEFGPWLGGVTEVLAPFGEVHVVDRFIWSQQNAEALPGLFDPDQSFRPLFEKGMAAKGIKATIHECTFADFEWGGGAIDLVIVDAPRTARGLQDCLLPIMADLRPGASVLIKNGLNPAYSEMMALIEILVGRGIFEIRQDGHPSWSTIAHLQAAADLPPDHDQRISEDFFAQVPLCDHVLDPWGGRMLTAARLAERVSVQDWKNALRLLSTAPADPGLLYAWDRFEQVMDDPDDDFMTTAVFAELVAAQIDPDATAPEMDTSFSCALRAWWRNNRKADWRSEAFSSNLLAHAHQTGFLAWPARLQDEVRNARIIEIGPDLDLSGVGYCAGGAAQYLGIETIELTATMMKVEAQLPRVTYLPISPFKEKNAAGATLCLVHAPAAGSEALVHDAVARLKPHLDKKAKLLYLPANGGQARPYRAPETRVNS